MEKTYTPNYDNTPEYYEENEDGFLTAIINKWWNTWHRFAEEDDLCEDEVVLLAIQKLDAKNIQFNLLTGTYTYL